MRTVLLFLVFVTLSLGAHAASFDCGRASTADERAVCADQRLSELDSLAGEAFSRVRQVAGPAEVTPVARDFLADRKACGANVPCIMANYVAVIGTYQNQGSKMGIPGWANAMGIAGNGAPRSGTIPRSVGQCVRTTVARVMPRLDPGHPPTSSDFDNGTAISFANKGYQVSYDRVEPLLSSQPGDEVVVCLTSIPRNCPPGDARGRTFAATNLRTGASWWLPDSEHSCGGA
jgi:uncharacterized protein